LNARELLAGFDCWHLTGSAPLPPDFDVANVITEPGKVTKNALYAATVTPMRDGHDGAAAAYADGCRLFLTERDPALPPDATVFITPDTEALLGPLAARVLGDPGRRLTVFGIAGARGKSSVALLAAALLRQNGRAVGTLTTDGTQVGDTFTPADVLVPDAAEIQHVLARFQEAGCEFAVLEFSAYQLTHGAAHGIPFAALLLTDTAPAHVGRGEFRRAEDYFAAVANLFGEPAPLVLLPKNDPPFSVRGHAVRFGQDGNVACRRLDPVPYACRFTISFEGEEYTVTHPVPGDTAIHNATAATALALAAGLPLASIAPRLSALTTPCRMERVAPQVFFDTAYTGEDLTRALSLLRPDTPGRLSVLTGSVGGRARQRRAPLGAAALRNADFVWFTTDDPDAETPDAIFRDLLAGDDGTGRYRCIADRKAALLAALSELRPGDALLVTGKGEPTYQLIAGERVPFSERAVIKEALG